MEASSKQELTFNGTGNVPDPKEFRARVYRNDEDEGGRELYLGKMIMEREGSLLIVGGKGESGSNLAVLAFRNVTYKNLSRLNRQEFPFNLFLDYNANF